MTDHSHDHHHHHHHHHGDGGLHFLHQLIVNNELPVLEGGVTWTTSGAWLDYGCANGEMAKNVFLPHAQKCGAKIVGVDKSQREIDSAKEHGFSEDSMTFIKADILGDWPFDKGTKFDKILGIHVLQYFENYEDFLVKALDVLKPGGELGLTLPIGKLVKLFAELEENPKCGKLNPDPDAAGEHGQWSANTDFIPNLRKFLVQQGVELTTFEFVPFEHQFKNLDHFAESVAYHWIEAKKLVSCEDKNEMKNIVKDYIKQVYDEIPADSAPWPLDISSLIVILKKPN